MKVPKSVLIVLSPLLPLEESTIVEYVVKFFAVTVAFSYPEKTLDIVEG